MKEPYVMTEAILSRLKTIRGVSAIICNHSKCDRSIEVGDKVISTINTNKNSKDKTKHWHEECYNSTIIDV